MDEPLATPALPGTGSPAPADPGRADRRARREFWRQVLSTRLLTTFAVLLTVVTVIAFGLAGVLIHYTTSQALEQQLARHLEGVARVAARRLDDPTYLVAARQSTAGSQWRTHFDQLARQVQEDARVSEVVLFAVGPAGEGPEVEILAAARAPVAQRDRLLGRLLADAVAIERALHTGQPASSSLYTDPDRGPAGEELWRKSAYAAIRDAQGAPLAIVGVELPADFREAVRAVDWRVFALGSIAGAAVLFTAVFVVRQRVHNPIFRLVRAMQGEEGGPPRRAKVRWPDEIGVLTECYNAMVDRLGEKDRELRRLYDQARETASYLQGYSNYLVAGVPSGVVAVDPKGQVTVWNPSAARILQKEALLGRPVAEQLEPDHPLSRALRSALQGSVTDQALVVLDVQRAPSDAGPVPSDAGPVQPDEPDEPDEEQRMVELTCAPFRGERGELLGAAALLTDRTELERFRRSASRNERLAAIGTLGAGLAHEIKNPLGAISGFAELIERKEGQDAARLAARLRGEVEELNRFLGEFLGFARDDTIRREPHDLRDLLRRGVEVALQGVGLDPLAVQRALDGEEVALPGGAPLRIRFALKDGVSPQAVDGTLLRAAFCNLAKNAIQAMAGARKGGELAVRLSRLEDVIFIRFRDQGPGIPLDIRERIFDPLFTTRAEGTGLGLAITHKTITAHGGKISVRDAPGGGAELVIRLPVVTAAGGELPTLDELHTPAPAGAREEDTTTWRAS